MDEQTLFENRDWRLTTLGLEHKGNGYFIARAQIGDRFPGGGWAWPMHLSEKTWCEPGAFDEAFHRALAAFGVEKRPGLGMQRREWKPAPHTAVASPADEGPLRLGAVLAAQLARLRFEREAVETRRAA
jgi:hypothetical protein